MVGQNTLRGANERLVEYIKYNKINSNSENIGGGGNIAARLLRLWPSLKDFYSAMIRFLVEDFTVVRCVEN